MLLMQGGESDLGVMVSNASIQVKDSDMKKVVFSLMVREQGMEGSIDWLRNVFKSNQDTLWMAFMLSLYHLQHQQYQSAYAYTV